MHSQISSIRTQRAIGHHFFPNATKDGQHWKIGDPSGFKGRSLGIQLTGDRAG
jgi:hypothetical protein